MRRSRPAATFWVWAYPRGSRRWAEPQSSVWLSQAMLSQAMLSQARLSQAMLSHARLSQAMLSQAMLSHARLSQARLSHDSSGQLSRFHNSPPRNGFFQLNGRPYSAGYNDRADVSEGRS